MIEGFWPPPSTSAHAHYQRGIELFLLFSYNPLRSSLTHDW